eukprot:1294135-Alexandrium_andersonii.AAC.1
MDVAEGGVRRCRFPATPNAQAPQGCEVKGMFNETAVEDDGGTAVATLRGASIPRARSNAGASQTFSLLKSRCAVQSVPEPSFRGQGYSGGRCVDCLGVRALRSCACRLDLRPDRNVLQNAPIDRCGGRKRADALMLWVSPPASHFQFRSRTAYCRARSCRELRTKDRHSSPEVLRGAVMVCLGATPACSSADVFRRAPEALFRRVRGAVAPAGR